LHHAGEIEAKSYKQTACFEGALIFARSEGIVPAPESSHAIRAAIDEAVLAKEEGKEKTILFGLSGHGQLDMGAYDAYLSGNLEDYEYPDEKIRESLERLPKVSL
jgi:tryptophan synthase beta chain